MSKDLRVVSISDVHIGHHVTLSESIYENLKAYFYPELTNETDILFICGDFFDRLLNLDSKSSTVAITFIHEIIQMSIKNNFIIRVLNGTFSHDKYQNQLFLTIADKYKDVNLKVITDISFERINELDTTVLYIPDDLPYNNFNEVSDSISKVLARNDVEKVDFIIGHGTLDYTIPKSAHKDKIIFPEEFISNLVEGYAIFGHIHTRSSREKIIYNGSFDRLAHGEEKSKGFYIVNRRNDKYYFKFVENRDASKFLTLRPIGDELEDLKVDLFRQIDKNFGPHYSGHLRIVCKDVTIRSLLYKFAMDKYPTLDITCKTMKEIQEEQKLDDEIKTFTSIELTENNISDKIYTFIKETNPDCICTLQDVQRYLNCEED